MRIPDNSAADHAQETLTLAANAQNAAAKQTRWFGLAVGICFVFPVLTSVLAPSGDIVAAVVAGVVASNPFFVVGVRALFKCSRLAVPNS